MNLRLEAWRDAERRRDGLARGTPEWLEAEEEVRSAEKAFHAAFAQAFARYAEDRFQRQNSRWSAEVDRRIARARE